MFNKDFFQKLIFSDFPLLQKFITSAIQVSSDEANRKQSPTQWQTELANAIPPELSYTDELKRTLLSILFLYLLQPKLQPGFNEEIMAFIKEHKSDLEESDLEKIRALALAAGSPIDFAAKQCQLFILSSIFGDICKIDAVRRYFSKHGLVSQDQDIAHDYLLTLDPKLLEQYFDLTSDQIKHLQAHQFPLHLGHAVQGECSLSKFATAHQFLTTISNYEQRKKLIDYVILKQLIDVAGARAQLGSILLNKTILNAYLKLKETLYKLANPEANPYQIYWQFIAEFLQHDKAINDQTMLNTIQTLSESHDFTPQGFIWRLILQLRIHLQSNQEKIAEERTMIDHLVAKHLVNDKKFSEAFAKIKAYERNSKYDYTYCPAIFATLKSVAEKNPAIMKNIADTPFK